MKKTLDYLLRPYQSVDIRKMTQVIAAGFFVIGSITAYVVASGALVASDTRYNQRLDRQAASMRSHIKFEFAQYEQLLESAGAFSELNERTMDRQLWEKYVLNSHAIQSHPAMLGMGYVDIGTKSSLAAYQRQLNQEYGRSINVHPRVTNNFYTSVSYLQPENSGNTRALGYDMFTDPTRRAAMEAARDTDSVQMSGPVHLVQDGAGADQLGALLYYPLYKSGQNPKTPEQRRKALDGYVYIVVRPSDVAKQIDKDTIDEGAGFVITDGSTNVYESNDQPLGSASQQFSLDVYGRTWNFWAFIEKNNADYWLAPLAILLGGILLSGFLSIVVYRLLMRRIKYLEKEHNKDLAETKNELVLLASHQLRTPASGVKQYLGMLTEGLAGDLDDVQASIIKKAYDANERQIETIDQILHVAKADAGQLALQYESVDLVGVIKDLIEEASSEVTRKHIKTKLDIPPSLSVACDKRFTTMAVENLISNAIKYSFDGGRVKITVKKVQDMAELTVCDHGVGVREEDSEAIFDKFVRADNPLSLQEGGTGLGLFLAREIAKVHKGSLSVAPNKKQGSIFTLRIPVKRPTKRKRKKQI